MSQTITEEQNKINWGILAAAEAAREIDPLTFDCSDGYYSGKTVAGFDRFKPFEGCPKGG